MAVVLIMDFSLYSLYPLEGCLVGFDHVLREALEGVIQPVEAVVAIDPRALHLAQQSRVIGPGHGSLQIA